uniref:SANT domain-containing protein n=1 Tax=Rhabditophanes sp. KR3021 TaxID=114890 RepID=A0AC35U160_9BILA
MYPNNQNNGSRNNANNGENNFPNNLLVNGGGLDFQTLQNFLSNSTNNSQPQMEMMQRLTNLPPIAQMQQNLQVSSAQQHHLQHPQPSTSTGPSELIAMQQAHLRFQQQAAAVQSHRLAASQIPKASPDFLNLFANLPHHHQLNNLNPMQVQQLQALQQMKVNQEMMNSQQFLQQQQRDAHAQAQKQQREAQQQREAEAQRVATINRNNETQRNNELLSMLANQLSPTDLSNPNLLSQVMALFHNQPNLLQNQQGLLLLENIRNAFQQQHAQQQAQQQPELSQAFLAAMIQAQMQQQQQQVQMNAGNSQFNQNTENTQIRQIFQQKVHIEGQLKKARESHGLKKSAFEKTQQNYENNCKAFQEKIALIDRERKRIESEVSRYEGKREISMKELGENCKLLEITKQRLREVQARKAEGVDDLVELVRKSNLAKVERVRKEEEGLMYAGQDDFGDCAPIHFDLNDYDIVKKVNENHVNFAPKLRARIRTNKSKEKAVLGRYKEEYERTFLVWKEKIDEIENSVEKKNKDREFCMIFEKTFDSLRGMRENDERANRYSKRQYGTDDLDVEVRKKAQRSAVFVPLMQCPEQVTFLNTNKVMKEPILKLHNETIVSELKLWDDDEKRTFKDIIALYPKNFAAIQMYLPRKTVQQCVYYYYLTKSVEEYKKSFIKKKINKTRKALGAPMPNPEDVQLYLKNQRKGKDKPKTLFSCCVECGLCKKVIETNKSDECIRQVVLTKNHNAICGTEGENCDAYLCGDCILIGAPNKNHRGYKRCMVGTCTNEQKKVKALKTISTRWNDLTDQEKEFFRERFKFGVLVTKCCTSCLKRIQKDIDNFFDGALSDELALFLKKREYEMAPFEWNEEMNDKLMGLVKTHGENWDTISNSFENKKANNFACRLNFEHLIHLQRKADWDVLLKKERERERQRKDEIDKIRKEREIEDNKQKAKQKVICEEAAQGSGLTKEQLVRGSITKGTPLRANAPIVDPRLNKVHSMHSSNIKQSNLASPLSVTNLIQSDESKLPPNSPITVKTARTTPPQDVRNNVGQQISNNTTAQETPLQLVNQLIALQSEKKISLQQIAQFLTENNLDQFLVYVIEKINFNEQQQAAKLQTQSQQNSKEFGNNGNCGLTPNQVNDLIMRQKLLQQPMNLQQQQQLMLQVTNQQQANHINKLLNSNPPMVNNHISGPQIVNPPHAQPQQNEFYSSVANMIQNLIQEPYENRIAQIAKTDNIGLLTNFPSLNNRIINETDIKREFNEYLNRSHAQLQHKNNAMIMNQGRTFSPIEHLKKQNEGKKISPKSGTTSTHSGQPPIVQQVPATIANKGHRLMEHQQNTPSNDVHRSQNAPMRKSGIQTVVFSERDTSHKNPTDSHHLKPQSIGQMKLSSSLSNAEERSNKAFNSTNDQLGSQINKIVKEEMATPPEVKHSFLMEQQAKEAQLLKESQMVRESQMVKESQLVKEAHFINECHLIQNEQQIKQSSNEMLTIPQNEPLSIETTSFGNNKMISHARQVEEVITNAIASELKNSELPRTSPIVKSSFSPNENLIESVPAIVSPLISIPDSVPILITEMPPPPPEIIIPSSVPEQLQPPTIPQHLTPSPPKHSTSFLMEPPLIPHDIKLQEEKMEVDETPNVELMQVDPAQESNEEEMSLSGIPPLILPPPPISPIFSIPTPIELPTLSIETPKHAPPPTNFKSFFSQRVEEELVPSQVEEVKTPNKSPVQIVPSRPHLLVEDLSSSSDEEMVVEEPSAAVNQDKSHQLQSNKLSQQAKSSTTRNTDSADFVMVKECLIDEQGNNFTANLLTPDDSTSQRDTKSKTSSISEPSDFEPPFEEPKDQKVKALIRFNKRPASGNKKCDAVWISSDDSSSFGQTPLKRTCELTELVSSDQEDSASFLDVKVESNRHGTHSFLDSDKKRHVNREVRRRRKLYEEKVLSTDFDDSSLDGEVEVKVSKLKLKKKEEVAVMAKKSNGVIFINRGYDDISDTEFPPVYMSPGVKIDPITKKPVITTEIYRVIDLVNVTERDIDLGWHENMTDFELALFRLRQLNAALNCCEEVEKISRERAKSPVIEEIKMELPRLILPSPPLPMDLSGPFIIPPPPIPPPLLTSVNTTCLNSRKVWRCKNVEPVSDDEVSFNSQIDDRENENRYSDSSIISVLDIPKPPFDSIGGNRQIFVPKKEEPAVVSVPKLKPRLMRLDDSEDEFYSNLCPSPPLLAEIPAVESIKLSKFTALADKAKRIYDANFLKGTIKANKKRSFNKQRKVKEEIIKKSCDQIKEKVKDLQDLRLKSSKLFPVEFSYIPVAPTPPKKTSSIAGDDAIPEPCKKEIETTKLHLRLEQLIKSRKEKVDRLVPHQIITPE